MNKNTLIGIAIIAGIILLLRQQAPATVTNAETWEWTDYKGNQRSITVHRDVHAT